MNFADQFYLAVLLTFIFYAPGNVLAAEKSNQPPMDCATPLQSAPSALQNVLKDLYHNEEGSELKQAATELNELVNAATLCRAYAQSGLTDIDRSIAMEWISLHQWIRRLADFVDANARGNFKINWKEEYAEFAKLYEFDI